MPCCKAEEYHWCKDLLVVDYKDEEGKEYCVFHAPESKKGISAEEFNERVFQRINEIMHINRLPSSSSNKLSQLCNLSGTIFEGDIDFNRFTIRNPLPPINLFGAIFTGEANFNKAIFSEEANFERVKFIKKCNFSEVTFNKEANFLESIFRNEAEFFHAVFSGEAQFHRAVFRKSTKFSFAKFEKSAKFAIARFFGLVFFFNASFNGWTNFKGAIFRKQAVFKLVNLNGNVALSGKTFIKEGDLIGLKIEKK